MLFALHPILLWQVWKTVNIVYRHRNHGKYNELAFEKHEKPFLIFILLLFIPFLWISDRICFQGRCNEPIFEKCVKPFLNFLFFFVYLITLDFMMETWYRFNLILNWRQRIGKKYIYLLSMICTIVKRTSFTN